MKLIFDVDLFVEGKVVVRTEFRNRGKIVTHQEMIPLDIFESLYDRIFDKAKILIKEEWFKEEQ